MTPSRFLLRHRRNLAGNAQPSYQGLLFVLQSVDALLRAFALPELSSVSRVKSCRESPPNTS